MATAGPSRDLTGDFAGLGRKRGALGAGGLGEQDEGFVIGEELDAEFLRVQRVEQPGVARGDERAAAGAEHVEGRGVMRLPHVVADEQRGLFEQQLAELRPALRVVFKRALVAERLRHVALEMDEIRLLAEGEPEDAVGIRLPHLPVVREHAGEHALADAAHPVQARARRRAGDDHGVLEVGEHGVLQRAEAILLREEMRRDGIHARHRDELAQRRHRVAEDADELPEVELIRIAATLAEVLRVPVHDLQAIRDRAVVSEAEDGHDGLLHFPSVPPLLRDIIRSCCRRADHEDEPVASTDGIGDFLMKRERAAGHVHAVEPHVEARRREVAVEFADEGFVIGAGVGEEDGGGHGCGDSGKCQRRRAGSSSRSVGKAKRTGWSRSACISRKVLLMKTRIVRQGFMVRVVDSDIRSDGGVSSSSPCVPIPRREDRLQDARHCLPNGRRSTAHFGRGDRRSGSTDSMAFSAIRIRRWR